MKKLAVVSVLLTFMVPSVVDSQSDGWRRATSGYQFAFPRDHASHPDYKLEWWYYTGNVLASDGRAFGYQITFFRIGVDRAPTSSSRWAIRDLFMAHLAISDLQRKRFHFAALLNRAGI
ncbi:MAG: carotenoid 1,2-hydratase, partial [Acidobacteria bacterium]